MLCCWRRKPTHRVLAQVFESRDPKILAKTTEKIDAFGNFFPSSFAAHVNGPREKIRDSRKDLFFTILIHDDVVRSSRKCNITSFWRNFRLSDDL